MSKREKMLDEIIYSLQGHDVVSVLERRGLNKITNDAKVLEDLVRYISRKMEMPWEECIDTMIDLYMEDNSITE